MNWFADEKIVIVIGEYGIGKHGIGECGLGEHGIDHCFINLFWLIKKEI